MCPPLRDVAGTRALLIASRASPALQKNLAHRTSSRIALSSPSSVSGYIRWPISWRTMRIE